MSLRHALLAVLTAEPMTGYDLVKYFDGTVAFVWSAPHSQIYTELRKMEHEGLLDGKLVARGERAEKRLFSITAGGEAELRRWESAATPYPAERSVHRLKAAYMEWSSLNAARAQLQAHIRHYRRRLENFEQYFEDMAEHRVQLLSRRLETQPVERHKAIEMAKAFAFKGEMSRARMEIEWANEGLAALDELERSGAVLAGDQPPA